MQRVRVQQCWWLLWLQRAGMHWCMVLERDGGGGCSGSCNVVDCVGATCLSKTVLVVATCWNALVHGVGT